MYMITSYTIRKMSDNIRTLRWTNIYETIMFPLLLKDVLLEMIGISQHHFEVTRKGKPQTNQNYQKKMAMPHMMFAALTLYGILHSIYVIFATGNVSLLFLLFWLCANMYNLIMALFFMLGRPAVRKYNRFSIEVPVKLNCLIDKEYEWTAVTQDISEGGFSFVMTHPVYLPPEEELTAYLETAEYYAVCQAVIVQVSEVKEGYKYACQITQIEEEDYKQLLGILHDRVPPLTMQVDTEHGFVDDLRTNFKKRREQTIPLHRKLPRIKMEEQVILPSSSDILTITSFNFRYITLTSESGVMNKDLKELTVQEGLTFVLKFSREFVQEESLAGLYEIVNYKELLDSDIMNQWIMQMYQNYKQSTQKQPNGDSERDLKKAKYKEFDELEQHIGA